MCLELLHPFSFFFEFFLINRISLPFFVIRYLVVCFGKRQIVHLQHPKCLPTCMFSLLITALFQIGKNYDFVNHNFFFFVLIFFFPFELLLIPYSVGGHCLS